MQIKTTMKYQLCLLEWLLSKRYEIRSVGEDVEKRESSYTVGRNITWCSHCGKQYEDSLKKLRVELSYEPAIPLFSFIQRKDKTLIQEDICTPMFISQHYLQ